MCPDSGKYQPLSSLAGDRQYREGDLAGQCVLQYIEPGWISPGT